MINVHGCGKSTVDKGLEIYRTGFLRRAQELKKVPDVMAHDELVRVWGIGVALAKELVAKGIRTRAELLARPDLESLVPRPGSRRW